ncbi:MAG: hypothetical protein WBB29_10530, partial [Geitlerinemataceae cyanobacterium]
MKPHTSLIPLLASLTLLAPRAGLGAIAVTQTENLGAMGNAGELSVKPLQLAQVSDSDPELLYQIAMALAKAGEIDRALEMAQTADSYLENSALSGIAYTLAKAGEIDRALTVAGTITDESEKAWALSGIAITLAEAGEIDRALTVAGTITDESEKAWALSGIAYTLAEAGVVDRALTLAGTITDESTKAWA